MYRLLVLTILASTLWGEHQESPKEIQRDLAQAEQEFNEAKKMFNPYYAGPLLTSSAHNVPPGHLNFQPYLFVTDTYGSYNGNRKNISGTDFWAISSQTVVQTGIFSFLDVTFLPTLVENISGGKSYFSIGDLPVQFGLQIVKESAYVPAVRLTLTETFPLGRYQRLDPNYNNIEATGGGAFVTGVSLNLSKVFWFSELHPIAARCNLKYAFSSRVDVQGASIFGGNADTQGTVSPGDTYQFNLGLEYSIAQQWVLACDLVYEYFTKTGFGGRAGTTPAGVQADLTGPSGDQLSISPAIEYNFSESMALLAGPWFSVTGRNSSSFVSGIVSFFVYF